jgi:anti-sigma B factor antagonist
LTRTGPGRVTAASVFDLVAMPYMSCPRCGLSIRLRAAFLTLENCPRCIAKAGIAIPMELSQGQAQQRRSERVGELVIRSEQEPQLLVLTLSGELDLASAPALEQLLDDAQETAVSRVVVDLSRLEFSDSAGLHVLLNAHRRLRGSGQNLVLRRGPKAVQRLFDLTGTDSIFHFEG